MDLESVKDSHGDRPARFRDFNQWNNSRQAVDLASAEAFPSRRSLNSPSVYYYPINNRIGTLDPGDGLGFTIRRGKDAANGELMATKHGYEALSGALVASQLSGVPFSAHSIDTPQSVEAAAMVQADVARALGSEVAGWKLGFVPNGGTVVSAPLFGNLILPDGGVYARGAATFLAIEAEIGFRLTGDPDAADPLSSLGSAFVGIEIVRSRFTEGGKAPFLAFLADNIGNGAYVIGPEQDDWRNLDLNGLRCRVWADERLIHDAVGGHPQNDPLAPLRAYASDPTDRLGGLRGGQFITTGTLCGVLAIKEACRIRVDVEQFGEVSVELSN